MTTHENEAQLQTAFVNYIKLAYPRVKYCASLGGQYQKFVSQRKKAKATGYIAGFPDIQICEPNKKYHGLFIEIKLNKRCYPSQFQIQWINDLNERGYYAVVCRGIEECINTLNNYMNNTL